MKRVSVVVIGFGDRAVAYTKYALNNPDRLEVKAVIDPNPFRRSLAKEMFSIPDEMLFEKMVNDQLKCTDGVNGALLMALAVANKGKCKEPELQRYLIDKFPKIKRHFGSCGELAFMAFCSQLMMYEYFVDEMIFKEKVYTEIAQIEREPIPEKK